MKNIIRLLIMFSIFGCSATLASDVATNTSSSTTKTSTSIDKTNDEGTTIESTTHTTTTSTTVDSIDDDIVSAIYAKFAKHPALIGTALSVSSENRIVTIDGTVTAQSQADAALIAAKSVNGVKDVKSLIHVTTNPNLNKSVKTPNY